MSDSENSTQMPAMYRDAGSPFALASEIGAVFHASEMFGKITLPQASILGLEMITKGLTPTDLLSRYHVIKGRLTLRSDFILAEFMRRGGEVIWQQFDGVEARARFIFRKNDIVAKFSFADATEAGYCMAFGKLKDNWKSSRPDMLRARLVSKTVRFLCPEIISGIYTPEEVSDFTPEELEIPKSASKPFFTEVKGESVKKENPPESSDIVEVEVEEHVSTEEPEEKTTEQIEGDYSKTMELLSENEEVVNSFCLLKNWITEGETFKNLKPEMLKMIDGNSERFIESAKKSAV